LKVAGQKPADAGEDVKVHLAIEPRLLDQP
jgi:hypothetical protein